jgi:carbon monoxide dehydrogenase subunit G
MKITNSFTVATPLEQTWATIVDVQRTANCLPGASVEATDEAGVFAGRMRVKLGAVITEYSGTARVLEIDEDSRTISFDVEGREMRGHGTAAATITNQLTEDGQGTRVTVETDLNVSGAQAQFGRGLMADVAGAMLDKFALRLEQEIINGPEAVSDDHGRTTGDASAPAVSSGRRSGDDEDDLLDIGAAAWPALARRIAPGIAALAVVGLLVGLVMRSRTKRGVTIHFNL